MFIRTAFYTRQQNWYGLMLHLRLITDSQRIITEGQLRTLPGGHPWQFRMAIIDSET